MPVLLNASTWVSHTDVQQAQRREFILQTNSYLAIPMLSLLHEFFSDALSSYVYIVLDLCLGSDPFTAITEKYLFHDNG